MPTRTGFLLALLVLTLVLAGLGSSPDLPWVILTVAFAIAFASASAFQRFRFSNSATMSSQVAA